MRLSRLAPSDSRAALLPSSPSLKEGGGHCQSQTYNSAAPLPSSSASLRGGGSEGVMMRSGGRDRHYFPSERSHLRNAKLAPMGVPWVQSERTILHPIGRDDS